MAILVWHRRRMDDFILPHRIHTMLDARMEVPRRSLKYPYSTNSFYPYIAAEMYTTTTRRTSSDPGNGAYIHPRTLIQHQAAGAGLSIANKAENHAMVDGRIATSQLALSTTSAP